MTARARPETQCMYFAYFEPYSWEQHLDLLGSATTSALVTQEHLGLTLQGRDMTLLRVTDADAATPLSEKKKVWVIGRQHPGETMAEWFIEGFLERLLDSADSVSRKLLQQCVFCVVPNMNPDGAVLGNLRTNAAGANLNREWLEPSMERSPEGFLVRQKMLYTGRRPVPGRARRRRPALQLRGGVRRQQGLLTAHCRTRESLQGHVDSQLPGLPGRTQLRSKSTG